MMQSPTEPGKKVGLLRRLCAMLYDSLLLCAVLYFATAILLPFTGGEAIAPQTPWYTLYLVVVSFLYFGGFWTRGGQTLGMRAWRMRLAAQAGGAVSWHQALARFLGAIVSWASLGLGFAWAMFDPKGMTWHDRWSKSVLVNQPKTQPGVNTALSGHGASTKDLSEEK